MTHYGLDDYVGEDVVVTAQPPYDDLSQLGINIFLYRVLESPHRRNDHLPTHDARGQTVNRPTLSLNLQFAVTAYADGDYQAEAMLGCAMQAFHEVPVINRTLIRQILSLDPGPNSLLDSRLAESIDSIRIKLQNLSEDVMSRVWSGFHVPYRLSAFYEVSLVLIESEVSQRVPLPVLLRPQPVAHASLGPVTPTLISAEPSSAGAGDLVTLNGAALEGPNVQIESSYRDPAVSPPPVVVNSNDVTDSRVTFTLPGSWPIGVHELRLTREPQGGGSRRPSNRLGFGVTPSVQVSSIVREATPPNLVNIQISVSPDIRAGQTTLLIVGNRAFPGPAVNADTGSITFDKLELPAGPAPLRLQVDGLESPWLDRNASPPSVLPAALVVVP